MRKYDGMPIQMGLSRHAVSDALNRLGFSRPTLYHSRAADSVAHEIALQNRINHSIDPDLEPEEWYVEYQGKKAGSNV